MKRLLLALFFLILPRFDVLAGPSTLLRGLESTAQGLMRRIPARGVGSGTVITPGYRPEGRISLPAELRTQYRFPPRVQFLDSDHTRFVIPGQKQSFNGISPNVNQEDDHSIRVNLKKN